MLNIFRTNSVLIQDFHRLCLLMTLQPNCCRTDIGNGTLATVVSSSQKVTAEAVSRKQRQGHTTVFPDTAVTKEKFLIVFDR